MGAAAAVIGDVSLDEAEVLRARLPSEALSVCDVRLRDIRDVWRARDLGFDSVIVGALPHTNPSTGTEDPTRMETRSQAPAPSPISSRRDAAQDLCARRHGTFLSHQGEALLHPRTMPDHLPCLIITLTVPRPLLTPLSLILLHPPTICPLATTTTTTTTTTTASCCTIQAMLAKGSVEFGGGAGKAACFKCLWRLSAHAATHRCRGPPACSERALPSGPERSALVLRMCT